MTHSPPSHRQRYLVDNHRPRSSTDLQLQGRFIVSVWIAVTNNHCPSRKLPLKIHQTNTHTHTEMIGAIHLHWSTAIAANIKMQSSIQNSTPAFKKHGRTRMLHLQNAETTASSSAFL